MNLNGSKPDDQIKANRTFKDISPNAQIKTDVSQRLGLLPSIHLEHPVSGRFSILVPLPSTIAIETGNTHAHSVREKISNGTVLHQNEVMAPHGHSLILTCKSIVHRDDILRGLAGRNMSRGRQTAVALSVKRAEEHDAFVNAKWYLPIEFNDSNSAIFETIRQFFRNTGMISGTDLIEDPSDGAIKRKVLMIHVNSDPWLKKYAPQRMQAMPRRVPRILIFNHNLIIDYTRSDPFFFIIRF